MRLTIPSQSTVAVRLAALAAFLLGSVLTGCRPSGPITSPAAAARPLPTLEAATLTLQPQLWASSIRSQGVLVADEVSIVGARAAGSVARVQVEFGDLIKAGSPLAELDREEFQLHVDQAEAALNQARAAIGLRRDDPVASLKPTESPPVRQERALRDEAAATLRRATELKSQNAIPRAEFDQIVAGDRVAEARYSAALNAVQEKIALIGVRTVELALARERLESAVVVAPFDGIVQERHVAPGRYVQIGDPIATLVRTDPLRFRGSVPERHAQSLKVGQETRLRIEGIAEPRMVAVTRISPSLEQASRSLLFEAEVQNGGQQLRSGLFAEAEILVNPQAVALVVPHSALVEFAGAEKVWKVVDGVASEQEVLAGQRRSTGIEILQGLTAGDVILRNGLEGGVARIKPVGGPQSPEGRSSDEGLSGGA